MAGKYKTIQTVSINDIVIIVNMWSDDSDFESPPSKRIRNKLDNILHEVSKNTSTMSVSGTVRHNDLSDPVTSCARLSSKCGVVREKPGSIGAQGGRTGKLKLNKGSKVRSQACMHVVASIGGGVLDSVNKSGVCIGSSTSSSRSNVSSGAHSGSATNSFASTNLCDVGIQVGVGKSSYNRSVGEDNMNYKYLISQILYSKDATINWLLCKGMIKNNRLCPTCGEAMKIVPVSQDISSDLYKWRCQRKIPKPHDIRLSLRHGSWFSNSNMTLEEIIEFTYLWCQGLTQKQIQQEVGCVDKTSVDWANFCREICEESLLKDTENGIQIGGNNIIVEIDESKFAKRKYNRGHEVKGGWVFGGREKDDKSKCFMVVVPDRTRATLLPIIQQHIAPGSIIRSDCWKAYDCLKDYGYQHETVNHSVNFKDPETGCHTNGIEGDWQKAKRSVCMPRFGVKQAHLQSFLSAHTWRRKHGERNLFLQFIADATKLNNGNCGNENCKFCY